MPTIAVLNNQATTDAEQVFDCRGATALEITVNNAAVYLRFAPRHSDVTGGLGLEELHTPKILAIQNEAIDQVAYRSAATGKPARIIITATRG